MFTALIHGSESKELSRCAEENSSATVIAEAAAKSQYGEPSRIVTSIHPFT